MNIRESLLQLFQEDIDVGGRLGVGAVQIEGITYHKSNYLVPFGKIFKIIYYLCSRDCLEWRREYAQRVAQRDSHPGSSIIYSYSSLHPYKIKHFMGKTSDENNKFYRLTLLEDSSHKKIRTIRFSKSGFVITIVTALVIMSVLIFCLIAFTPIRTAIPGYPDARSKKQAVENAIKIDSLENIIIRWELYSENLSRVLAGDETVSLDSIVRSNNTKFIKNVSKEVIEKQDSLLRKQVEGKWKSAE